ncbi:unnamed protein product [Didymodactylos carnosus]|uniref:Neurotransmitter-gated ion-channel transmembrane domain-containing protein n=1 Tax=Didymodactylos carnosus TaxID=1234261 RepID=A0A8S2CS59_9BILA|nr:unnamed protein product [Didymodactylos carnosus]CAF3572570.1 unnamed protein product [Didymodactylos carnosus]
MGPISEFEMDDSEIQYEWKNDSIAVAIVKDLMLNQFSLIATKVGRGKIRRYNHTQSVIYVMFKLRRNMGYFLLQLYCPCSLVVFISWVGCWLNREATNDRINLGVTTVLTMAFIIIDGKKELPKISYVTALDYYLGVCFGFVFSTLFQFACVHFNTKAGTGDIYENIRIFEDCGVENNISFDESDHDKQTINTKEKQVCFRPTVVPFKKSRLSSISSCLKCKPAYSKFQGKVLKNIHYSNSVSKLDILARILYPLCFFAFNLFYWVYYINISDESLTDENVLHFI